MKTVNFKTRILCIFVALALVVILPLKASAIEYTIANKITLGWDVVAPVNVGETIEYAIYQAVEGDKPGAVKLWQGPELEYTVTMVAEGIFLFGLETYRLVDIGGTIEKVSNSAIGWSDDPAVAPVPFGVRHYAPPPMATGFGPR